MPGWAATAPVVRAADCQSLGVQVAGGHQSVDGEADDALVQPCEPSDLVQAVDAGFELLEDGASRAGRGRHESCRPTWNTATASSHAVDMLIAMLASIQRRPTSRFSAASVATQGV